MKRINEFLSILLKLGALVLVLVVLYWGVRHGWLTNLIYQRIP